jgi:hypothetical protein
MHALDHLDYMKEYIVLAENLRKSADNEPVVEEVTSEPAITPIIISDLEELVFKMRSVMETSGGDYALGYEDGFANAAEMVENLIRRHKEGRQNLG